VAKSRKKKTARSTSAKRAASAKRSSRRTATRRKASAKKKSAARASTKRNVAVAQRPPDSARSAARSNRSPRPLTPRDVEEFRDLLLKKRDELVGDVAALNEAGHNSSGNLSTLPQHMADIGSDNYEQEFALTLMEGERALLREIDDALQRIAQGTFGVCVATGKPIGKARLKATPWARYCYEYVLEQEQRGRRRF
jgi:DnaK suppressor protein